MFLETSSARLPPPLAVPALWGGMAAGCAVPGCPRPTAGTGRPPPGGPMGPRVPAPCPQSHGGSRGGPVEPFWDLPLSAKVGRPGAGQSGASRAWGKDFKLSIERVSVLFLIKSFFKWWRWPKFHTTENKVRRKACWGHPRPLGRRGGSWRGRHRHGQHTRCSWKYILL